MLELLKYGFSIALVNILALLAGTQSAKIDLKPLMTSERPSPSPLPTIAGSRVQVTFSTTTPEITPPLAPTPSPTPDNLYQVTKVIDGQTLLLDNGQEIRYSGISVAASLDEKGCVNNEDVLQQKELLENKLVRIEWNGDDDKEGYVFLSDGTLVNVWLVKNGLAKTNTTVNIKYNNQLQNAEQEAKANQSGLWSKICVKATGDSTHVQINQNIHSSSSINSSTKIKIENRN